MPHHAPTHPDLFVRSLAAAAAAAYLIVLACPAPSVTAHPPPRRAHRGAKPKPKPTPAPTPSPPLVEFQAVPSREVVQSGEDVAISLFVSNKSDARLTNLSASVPAQTAPDESFVVSPNSPQSLAELPPFASAPGRLVVQPRGARFGAQKLLLTLNYSWEAGGRSFTSALPATVSLDVRRRFDEEAQGFPGGTAAFLYLLLPIMPALLGYQLVERLRKGEGLRMPTFDAAYIVPAFFLAVVLSLLMLAAVKSDRGLDYSNPWTFLYVLAGSFAAGVLIPTLRGLWYLVQRHRWGFKSGDSLPEYLRKAVRSPYRRDEYRWVSGTVGGEEWKGILLRQPNGANALGARLQVSPQGKDDAERTRIWNDLVANVLAEDGTQIDPKRLVRMVKDGTLSVQHFVKVQRAGAAQNTAVFVEEVKDLQPAPGAKPEPLVLPRR